MVSKSISTAPTSGGPASLRRVHRAMALRELSREPGIARVDLANRLGLSSMAIGRIVRELEQAGLAGEIDGPLTVSGRGRPPTGLQLQVDGAYVIGAAISAFSQEAHILDIQGHPVASVEVEITDVTDGPATVKQFCRAIRKLVRTSRIAPQLIVGAGFAVAASVNPVDQTVMGGGYLGWSSFDLAGMAQKALGIPVTVNKIADALLRADAFIGCARQSRAAVLIHTATILGSSFLSNDQLVHGGRYRAGRIGHFPVQSSRLVCSCGASDCLNCTASGWSILSRLGRLDSNSYQLDQIQTYSRLIRSFVNADATPADNRIARDAGAALAKGLRYLDLMLDPDIMILAGPLASHDAYFDGVVSALQRSSSDETNIRRRLVRSQMTPAIAAGVIALLDTTFSPSLDLERLNQPKQLAGKA